MTSDLARQGARTGEKCHLYKVLIPFPVAIDRLFRPRETYASSSNQGQDWKMKAVPASMAHEEQPFGR